MSQYHDNDEVKTWLWSKLSGAKWIDAWEERFHGNSNLAIELIKGGKTARIQIYCQSLEEAETIKQQFGGSVRGLRNSDWQKETKVPPPLKIRDRLLITQESKKAKLGELQSQYPQRFIISIPPEMAFGTGEHATTSNCLRYLVDIAKNRQSPWNCADLGGGSGVLAIAARKLGANPVFYCDFDPLAVVVAKRNVERNGTADIEIQELDLLQFTPNKKYDVILANLFSDVLIQGFETIARMLAPKGDLVLSGILAEQAWQVFKTAAQYGIGFPEVKKRGKWVTAKGSWMNDLNS